jgi:hypothetical protein
MAKANSWFAGLAAPDCFHGISSLDSHPGFHRAYIRL